VDQKHILNQSFYVLHKLLQKGNKSTQHSSMSKKVKANVRREIYNKLEKSLRKSRMLRPIEPLSLNQNSLFSDAPDQSSFELNDSHPQYLAQSLESPRQIHRHQSDEQPYNIFETSHKSLSPSSFMKASKDLPS
jgi:hypothetical protein